MSGVADSLTAEDPGERRGNNLQIQPKGAMVDIPDIEFEFLFPGDGIPAVNLSPTSDSRLDFLAPQLFRRVAMQILHEQRPGSHKAHLTVQDVQQFGQLVQRSGSEKPADSGESFVIRQKITVAITVIVHSAELEDSKWFPVQPGPQLAEKDLLPLG